MNEKTLAKKISVILNEKIDIPKIPEWLEGFIFRQAASIIIGIMNKYLPEDWFIFITDISKGLIDEDVEFIKERFEKFLNPKIDIPFLTEEQEGELMKDAVQIVLDYLKIGNAIPE